MTVLDKIKAFIKLYGVGKWYGVGMGVLEPKPEVKGAGKKAAEPPETKVAEAPEMKGDESSSR